MFRDGDIVWVRVVLDVLYGSATITLEPHASARVLKLEGLNGPGDLPYWPAMVQQTLSGDADSVGVRMKVAVPPFWVTSEVKETGKARCHIYIERTHRAFTADAGYHAYKLRLLGGVDISVDVMERFIQPFVAFKPPASQILAPEVIDEVEKVTEEPVLRCYLSAVAQAVGYISSTMIAGDNDSLRLGAERIMVGDTVRVRRRSKEGEAERDARDGCAWDLMDVRRIEWLMSADVLADVLKDALRKAKLLQVLATVYNTLGKTQIN
ncbi:hypothetical protein HK104_006105 [Borealophlyctis nickersoniae]|nr:hypothetical protein HK104_006105 [Borealophlyctis nickersoniae]